MSRATPIAKTSLNKNPFIGLFVRASDELLILPPAFPEKLRTIALETLGTQRVVETTLCNSNLVGLFCVLNKTGAVISPFCDDKEEATLRKAGLNVTRAPDAFAAVGNDILCNDRTAFVHARMPRPDAQRIGDALGVEVHQQHFSCGGTIGAANVVTNAGLLAHNELTDVEIKRLEGAFGVHGDRGTTNLGNPFNALSVVANARGALVGELTSGFELQRVYQSLFSGDTETG